jgi:hypothetical protein
MTARKERARSPREIDLLDLRTRQRRSDARAAHALVTVLCRADAPTLAALGVVLRFVVRWAPRRRR